MIYAIDIPPEYQEEAAALLNEFLRQKNKQDGTSDLLSQLRVLSEPQALEILSQQSDHQLARLYSLIASIDGSRTQAGQSIVDDAYRYGLSPGQRARLSAMIVTMSST